MTTMILSEKEAPTSISKYSVIKPLNKRSQKNPYWEDMGKIIDLILPMSTLDRCPLTTKMKGIRRSDETNNVNVYIFEVVSVLVIDFLR